MSQPRQIATEGSSARRIGGLWSYILPAAPSTSSPLPDADTDATTEHSSSNSTLLPPTGPSDRSAVSVRLMLGDAKAALQQLSDRVERVADEAANARREVAEAARGVEEAQGGILKQIQNVVKQVITSVQEANIAHTSSLEAASARIANLEASLAAQARAISDLSQACAVNQLKMTELLDRITQTHSTVLSFSPTVPLLQAIPTEIANANLSIKNAVEHLQVESLRTARDTRLELQRLSEEQARAMSSTISQLFCTRDRTWRELLDGVVGHMKGDLEKCKEGWATTLSMHRQEMYSLLSAHLAVSASGSAIGMSIPRNPRVVANEDMSSGLVSHAPPKGEQSRCTTTLPMSSRMPHQKETPSDVEGTIEPAQPMNSEIAAACGTSDSISRAACGTGRTVKDSCVRTHSSGETNQSQNLIHQHTEVNTPDSYPIVTIQPRPEAQIESQPTAPPPPLARQESIRELADLQNLNIEAQVEDPQGGRLFGALNRPNRTSSANIEFPKLDSPPFSVHRKKLAFGKAAESFVTSNSAQPQATQWTDPRAPSPVITTSPCTRSADSAQAPTLGRSCSQSSISYLASPPIWPTPILQKRYYTPTKQGPSKRQKTRILMTAEDCESDEE